MRQIPMKRWILLTPFGWWWGHLVMDGVRVFEAQRGYSASARCGSPYIVTIHQMGMGIWVTSHFLHTSHSSHIAFPTFHMCHIPYMLHSLCITFPKCHIPYVSHSLNATFPMCYIPYMQHSPCVTFPTCHIPRVSYSLHSTFHGYHIPYMPHSPYVTFPTCRPHSPCVTFPTFHICHVSHSLNATFPMCHIPYIPHSPCVTFPTCHIPHVSHSLHTTVLTCHIPYISYSPSIGDPVQFVHSLLFQKGITFRIKINEDDLSSRTYMTPDNGWRHLVLSYTDTKKIKIYYDGVLVSKPTVVDPGKNCHHPRQHNLQSRLSPYASSPLQLWLISSPQPPLPRPPRSCGKVFGFFLFGLEFGWIQDICFMDNGVCYLWIVISSYIL